MAENINLKYIWSVSTRPDKCIKCGNQNLRSNIISGSTGNPSKGVPMKPIEHVYCDLCEGLMIWT